MYCVCKEHVDRAMEMFVEEYEQSPDLYNLAETNFSDWDPPLKCEYCESAAEFLVV